MNACARGAPHGALAADLDRFDCVADDVAVEAAADGLDLGSSGIGSPSRTRRARPRARGAPARPLLRPASPSPTTSPSTSDRGEEALGVVRALVADVVDGAGASAGAPAPAARSCSRAGRALAGVVEALAEQPLDQRRTRPPRPPSRYTAPITASIASARIDGFSRPPAASSPLPSRRRGPRSSSAATSASAVGVHDALAQLGQLALGHVRVGAEDVVGDDQAEHGVAEELEPLVATVVAGSRRTTSGGPAPGEQRRREGHRSVVEPSAVAPVRVDGRTPAASGVARPGSWT